MMIDNCPTALIDLFDRLRPQLRLTIEQYGLFFDAWQQGHGQNDWEELRLVCKLIWLKTNRRTDLIAVELFDREFDAWQQECQENIREWFDRFKPSILPPEKTTPIQLGTLPSIPRRRNSPPPPPKTPDPIQPEPKEVAVALKGNKPHLAIQKLPINLVDIQRTWRSLKSSIPDRRSEELDLDKTLAKLNWDGHLNELVMRSDRRSSLDLLLLIDDHHHLRPYRPVYTPLIQSVSSHRVTPAKIYRFIGYPVDYLHDWEKPIESVDLKVLLSRLHSQRTVVFIVSDGGAAMGRCDRSRIIGTQKFLGRLLPSVREVFWFNPVPEQYWLHTSAAVINRSLGGRMMPFEKMQWQKLGK
jgi:uncharacterized protein